MRRAVPDLTSIKPPRAADGAGTAKGETMKIIVIGATGTIGSEVVKALLLKKHEVVRASRNGDVKVTLDDSASVRALFERAFRNGDWSQIDPHANSDLFRPPIPTNNRPPRHGSSRPAYGLVDKAPPL